MKKRVKASRYNHIVTGQDGDVLGFNAMSCGLGSIDPDKRDRFAQMTASREPFEIDSEDEFCKELFRGGFLIPEDLDELSSIRAAHYSARFSEQSTGMTIIPTLNCNFACDYCYEDSSVHVSKDPSKRAMSEEVQDNLVELAESRIKENSVFTVTWYGGEPLLRLDIIESLSKRFKEICERKQSRYFAGIITNGYLLTPRTAVILAQNGVKFCQVTLDGVKAVHDSRRPLRGGSGTFDRIVENVTAVSEQTDLTLSIRINADNRNSSSISELLCDLRKRGLHDREKVNIYFGQVLEYSNSCRDTPDFCMANEEFADFQVVAYRKALELDFRISTYPFANLGNCGAVKSVASIIEPSGDVHNCWNTVGRHDMRTGDLTHEGVDATRNSINWLGWTPFAVKCNDCEVLPVCMGGCPYRSLFGADENGGDNGTCIWWKFNLRKMLELFSEAQKRGKLAVSQRKR
ncbi:MAG: SPASM domain-containing protein [candidate division Zixibacteria bacterium]|nr:SPASM domain-containing protein [candidate division Zixibacteria bacterium]MBU1470093.1 SPASM domain-containing protein [candidate division Zixibacteria bacterium]MBU2624413.1 SPASM domain-containing protein [candidate division Zixibacteria bacterium]